VTSESGSGWSIMRQLKLEVQERAQQIAGSFALVPALITWFRFIAAGLLIIVVYGSGSTRTIFWIILAGAMSDYLDGWVARRMKRNTYPGKVMDFTADKLFVSVALIIVAFNLGGLDTFVASVLTAYHLLLLFSLSVISWSVHVPVVTITTGERLAILFSYLLLITATGRMAFPQKQIFSSLYLPLMIIALLSALTGLLSYMRLLRRILARILE
jgi:phosphatidylglycerophosphate synthase